MTPLVHGAYFDAFLDVALRETKALVPGANPQAEEVGGLVFLDIEAPEDALPSLRRLSFVQGVFGEDHTPLPGSPEFRFPRSVVFGAKYRGRTNEVATQLALNLALHACDTGRTPTTLLDPLAGRGTTLLWGLQYGLNVTGIEVDPKAPPDLHRHLKRQAKLHRLKHQNSKGSIGPKTKSGAGRFLRFEFGSQSLQLVTGDSANAPSLLAGQKFDLLVTDLPYGVQFGGKGNTIEALVRTCMPAWFASLRPGGAMAVLFNTYQPSREALTSIVQETGGTLTDLSAPHRVSESIVRDIVVATRPKR